MKNFSENDQNFLQFILLQEDLLPQITVKFVALLIYYYE